MKRFFSNKAIILLCFAAFALRIAITPLAFHDDLIVNATWGEWVDNVGALGFYDAKHKDLPDPTQPPLISLLYGWQHSFAERQITWVLRYTSAVINNHNIYPGFFAPLLTFTDWFDSHYGVSPHKWSVLITMKIIPILSDVAIGLGIYFLARRRLDNNMPLLFAALYQFSPFSWYVSALWGQYDQVAFLFSLISFLLLLHPKFVLLAPLFFVISVGIKPTTLIFAPLFAFGLMVQRPRFAVFASSLALAVGSLVLTVLPFSGSSLWPFIDQSLLPAIFDKADHRLVNNAFNFWKIFAGQMQISGDEIVLIVSNKLWGFLVWGIMNILAFSALHKAPRRLDNMLVAIFTVSAGGFMFLTNMLERYYFAGVISLLFVCIYKPKLLPYWVLVSIIFWINLYKEWWYPDFMGFMRDALLFDDYVLVRLLSLANLVIFLAVLYLLRRYFFQAKKAKKKKPTAR